MVKLRQVAKQDGVRRFLAVAVLCVGFVVASPDRAAAQVCEFGGLAESASNTAINVAQKGAVEIMTNALKTAATIAEPATKEIVKSLLWNMDKALFDKLDWFWGVWEDDLKGLTAQMHASTIEQTMRLLMNMDADNLSHNILRQQKAKLDGHESYSVNEQGGRFDTAAKSIARSQQVGNAVASGYGTDFNKVGGNKKGTTGAEGPPGLQRSRWEIYKTLFCDKNANNGAAGCDAANAAANMHILPSKTIFSKETIDMTDDVTREAVHQLLYNITGYEASRMMQLSAMKSSPGLEQMRENREYMAQMDAVGTLAYSVVADRFPGEEAAGLQEMRMKVGARNPSPTPSAREIRQSLVDQLSDPGYYAALHDPPSTLSQKELYLKAYNLMMLYEMIARQEKISNVYAIETANILDLVDHSRHGAVDSAPVSQEAD